MFIDSLQRFMAFPDFAYVFLSVMKKVITTSSSFQWCVYAIFINIASYHLHNFVFGESETQILRQPKFSTFFFFCSSKGRAVGRHSVWLFYPSVSLDMCK